MFVESYWIKGEENPGGGTVYAKLVDREDTVLLAEFGLTEEASYITRREEEWHFTAAFREDDDINKPAVRRIFEADKEKLREELRGERFFYGEAIAEAWDNWSEGDGFHLRIDGDEREFEADHQRLWEYERGY